MRRHPKAVGLLLVTAGIGLVGCGGSKSTPEAANKTTVPVGGSAHVAKPVSSKPSTSAKMICESEVNGDLEQLLGVKVKQPLEPSWKDHVYSCRYVYDGGVMTLSVKELANQAETDAYYASLGAELGKTEKINGLGEGAFTTKNLSAVVRKDYKVLLVDISGLPAEFGTPPDTRADIALNVASTIMGCWTGE